MANTIRDFSATASINTIIAGLDIDEGCSPANINDAIRELMADLKDVSTGAVALESPAADSLSVTGNVSAATFSGDGSSLTGIPTPTLTSLGISNHDDITVDASGNLDVTGTVTADGLTVNGTIETINGTDINMDGLGTGQLMLDGLGYKTAIALSAQGANLYTNSSARAVILGTNETQRLRVQGNGDISFYDNTGTTQGLFWDASTQALGLGTTTPQSTRGLHVVRSNANQIRVEGTGSESGIEFKDSGTVNLPKIGSDGDDLFFDTAYTQRMSIDSSGRVTMPSQPHLEMKLTTSVSVANNGYVDIPWDSIIQNQGGFSLSNSNSRITVPVTGVYLINAKSRFQTTSATVGELAIMINGSYYSYDYKSGADGYESYREHQCIKLSASDYIEIRMLNQSGTTYDITGNSSGSTTLNIQLLS